MISLNTKLVNNGQLLTFDGGKSAGMIYVRSAPGKQKSYRWSTPIGPDHGVTRRSLLAAQYDALAWAEDQEGSLT